MKTNAPKKITWLIGLIVGILGIIGHFAHSIPVVSPYNWGLTAAGFVILALGTSLKGL